MLKYAIIIAAAATLAGCNGGLSVENGEEALARGDFRAAAKCFAASVKRNPSSVPLLYNLGVARALAGDTKDAILAFRDVLRFSPGDLDASEYLAAELCELGTPEALMEAHELLEFALRFRKEPLERARALNSIALVEQSLHRTGLAVARFIAAIEAAPGYLPARFNLALLCARDLKLPAAAKRELDAISALDAKPEDSERLQALAASIEGTLPKPYDHVTMAEAAALIKEGAAAYAKNDYKTAIEQFGEAAKIDPFSFDAAFNSANAFLASGNYIEAEKFFEKAAELDPSRFDVAFWRTRLAYTSGDYAKVVAQISGNIAPSWPDEPQGFFLGSYAYAQLRQYTEARLYGELYLAKVRRQNPSASQADFESWLMMLPETKFKP